MLNNQIRIITAILFFSLSCNLIKHSGKTPALPGTWQAQPIAIDGNSKDWPSPYPNYDAKAMVAYAASNDMQNLYITMQTGDELTQMKILKQGMTIMIDTGGKKDAQLLINYPLPNDNDPVDFSSEDMRSAGSDATHGKKARWEKRISKSADQANQFSIEGSKDCNGGYTIAQTNACGIKVRLRIDEYKELVWEAVIPFKAIYNKDAITAADAGKPISVCYAVKGFKKPADKNAGNNNTNTGMNGSMPGAGTNSRMNAGGGGGQVRPANHPMQHLYESTKTWKHFGLAVKP
jgi:hypothetical protein